MTKDKRLLYILSGVFTGVLLLCCFTEKAANTNLWLALTVAAFAAAFGVLLKKRILTSPARRQVLTVLLIASLAFIGVYLMTGLGFGYYRTPLNSQYWWRRAIPYTVAIIGAEYIRHVMLSQESKLGNWLSFCLLVLFDAALFRTANNLGRFVAFWEFASMTVIPSLSANLLYGDVSRKYGFLPVIAYRIPLAIYPYFLPMAPNMPAAMLSLLRLLLPIAVLLFLRTLYGKNKKTAPRPVNLWNTAATLLCVLCMTVFVMLISCRFQYGILVIATDSMTGSQNKGDAVIYERYDGQDLNEGQVIVFSDNDRRVVHRITRLQKINGQLQVYTKGDANETEDTGFATADEVIGTECLTIPYLGYPTVWMRELFN